MVEFIATIDADLEVHPIPRTGGGQGPHSFIPFLNGLAVMFKVHRAMGR